MYHWRTKATENFQPISSGKKTHDRQIFWRNANPSVIQLSSGDLQRIIHILKNILCFIFLIEIYVVVSDLSQVTDWLGQSVSDLRQIANNHL